LRRLFFKLTLFVIYLHCYLVFRELTHQYRWLNQNSCPDPIPNFLPVNPCKCADTSSSGEIVKRFNKKKQKKSSEPIWWGFLAFGHAFGCYAFVWCNNPTDRLVIPKSEDHLWNMICFRHTQQQSIQTHGNSCGFGHFCDRF